jgi:hypothetical protein
MVRKDVIIAILATFFLSATLFIVLPTKSSPSAGPEYDPWADINDDGRINMYDIGYTAQRFGTSGDPTKNVTVINWEVDCYHHYSIEIVVDKGKASVGNAEPVSCYVHVTYQGLPVMNLVSDNFHTCTIATPKYGISISFKEALGCDGCYLVECVPFALEQWAAGAYVFYIGVRNPPPPSASQYDGVTMTSFAL